MMRSNTAQVAPDATDAIQPVECAELRACFHCEHYDPSGPHDRSRGDRIQVRCLQRRRLGEKGLTPVVDSLEDCEPRRRTIIFHRR